MLAAPERPERLDLPKYDRAALQGRLRGGFFENQLYLTVLSDVFPGWCVHVYAVLGFLGPDRVRLQWNHKIYEYF